MKNNVINKFLVAILVVLTCTTNVALAAHSSSHSQVGPLMRLVYVMGGIVITSVVLSVGLSIYNKFFVSSEVKDYKLRKDSLRAPSDKDEAIVMFLTKNKMK